MRNRRIQPRPSQPLDRTLAAQALLAGIAERGADAVGYAYRAAGPRVTRRHKQRSGASALLDRVEVPSSRRPAARPRPRLHEGPSAIAANNHPVRHGPVVGIHNGIIVNDDELLAAHGFERARAAR